MSRFAIAAIATFVGAYCAHFPTFQASAAADQPWTLQHTVASPQFGPSLCGDTNLIWIGTTNQLVNTTTGRILDLPKEFNYGAPVRCSSDGKYIFNQGNADGGSRKWVAYKIDGLERTELSVDPSVRLSGDGHSAISWSGKNADFPAPWGNVAIYWVPDFPQIIPPWYQARGIAVGLYYKQPSYIRQPLNLEILDLQSARICRAGPYDAYGVTVGRNVAFLHSHQLNDGGHDVDVISIQSCTVSEPKPLARKVECFDGYSAEQYTYCDGKALKVRDGGKVQELLNSPYTGFQPLFSPDGNKLYVRAAKAPRSTNSDDPFSIPIIPTWIFTYTRNGL